MALYDITNIKLATSPGAEAFVTAEHTTFTAQGIHERAHLQAAIRDRIELIDEDLYVIAEEFGDFEGANRRIDLLCIDRACQLVVLELKRTSDGGHMELQAIRYAAMVSTMSFSQVVRTLAKYRKARALIDATEEAARADLLTWLDHEDDEDPVVSRDVGIVLVSEDFSQEITTTVLWLNEFHQFDVRCVRLTPYLLDSRVLLDVQQVIPLPEASEYTVLVKEKEATTAKAQKTSGADRTKFVVKNLEGVSKPLSKRRAMLRLVQALFEVGVSADEIGKRLPPAKWMKVDGVFATEDERWTAIQEQHGKPDSSRWHLASPLVVENDSYFLHKNWGIDFRRRVGELMEIAPEGFAVYPEGQKPGQAQLDFDEDD